MIHWMADYRHTSGNINVIATLVAFPKIGPPAVVDFESVTLLSVCPAENPKIPKSQNFAGLDGGRATHSGRSYAVGSC